MTATSCKMLVFQVIGYIGLMCGAAAIFQVVEYADDVKRRNSALDELHEFLVNHTCVDADELAILIEMLTGQGLRDAMVRNLTDEQQVQPWSMSPAFGFVISIVTTIGYGNVVPGTDVGRMLVVITGVVGIPITLMLLNNIGNKLIELACRVSKLKLAADLDPKVKKCSNIALVSVVGAAIMFIFPALIFSKVEEWTYIETLYYCFVTLSTMGMGDYVVGVNNKLQGVNGAAYKIFSYAWILTGLAYISLIIKFVTSKLEKKSQSVNRTKTMKIIEGRMSKLSDGGVRLARNIPAMFGRRNTLAIKSTTKESSDSSLFNIHIKKIPSSPYKINESDVNESGLSEKIDENENNSGAPNMASKDHGASNGVMEWSSADPDFKHDIYEIVDSLQNKQQCITQDDVKEIISSHGSPVGENAEKSTIFIHEADENTAGGDVYIVSDDIEILEKDDVLANTEVNLDDHGHKFVAVDADHETIRSPEYQTEWMIDWM